MKNKYDWIIIALFAAGFLFWCVALSGCYTNKKAAKAITKAILLKPVIAAGLTRTAFPCITVKADTTYNSFDTTIIADCPPLPQPVIDYFAIHDTAFFNNVIIKKVQVPVRVTLPGVNITKYVKDNAEVLFITDQNYKLQQQVDKQRSLKWSLLHLFTFWQIWATAIILGLWAFRKQILNKLT